MSQQKTYEERLAIQKTRSDRSMTKKKYRNGYSWEHKPPAALETIAYQELVTSWGSAAENAEDTSRDIAYAFGRLLECLVDKGTIHIQDISGILGASTELEEVAESDQD